MNINATLFAQFVVFFILALFTMRFVWRPIMEVLGERARRVADGLLAAEKAKSELSSVEKQVQEQLKLARQSAFDIRSLADAQAARMLEDARKEATLILQQAQKLAEAAAGVALQQAKESLRDQLSSLVIAGASKILRREVDEKTHAQLLQTIKQEF